MRVLICDDHELFRAGLVSAVEELDENINIEQVGDLASTRSRLAEVSVDYLLLDLHLPDGIGHDIMKFMQQAHPTTRVVFVSASEDTADIRRALDSGAQGFIPKSHSKALLLGALQIILAGGQYAPPASLLSANSTSVTLTARQSEILAYMAKGLTNQDIADVLGISLQTVKVHVKLTLAALGAANRAEAATIGASLGLLDN